MNEAQHTPAKELERLVDQAISRIGYQHPFSVVASSLRAPVQRAQKLAPLAQHDTSV